MDMPIHSMQDLFAQLGLPHAPPDIQAFLLQHRPLDPAIALPDAPFWNPAQAALLRQKLAEDSDWALLVDGLNAQLRAHSLAADPHGAQG